MVSFLLRHSLLLCIAALACAGLPGCVTVSQHGGRQPGTETLAEFMTSMGRTRLVRAANGTHSMQNSENVGVNLTGHIREPSVVGVYDIPGGSVVALQGSNPGCPRAYLMVQLNRSQPFMMHHAGDCISELGFKSSSHDVEAYQLGTADPLLWQITYGKVTGPIRRSKFTSRPLLPPPPPAPSAPSPPAGPAASKPGAAGQPRSTVPRPVRAAGQDIVPKPVKPRSKAPAVPTIQLDGPSPAPGKQQPSPP